MVALQFLDLPVQDPPSGCPKEESLTLRQVYPSPPAGDPDAAKYTIETILHCLSSQKWGMKRVYRAIMRIESTGDTKTVICKVAMGRTHFAQLKREGRIYDEHLKGLQGTVVPHVYGFFAGRGFDGKTGVLVMEECGVPLRMHYSHYPLGFKRVLIVWL
ncbi:hypothetical protein K466DRAFT_607420 [Polyporus arcularius HHB13444]|uniref:Protein kinase domain-containing protein n=1 Tax=Polyporus arcularius HHB13444 TaxID=1314778 RepID=A0A5C3NMV7_9APHY|nr:hypothetical protein K466DRAFT_607420 [Polyporus arcularius HHB13444]